MLQKWPRILLVILVSRLDWLEGMGRVDRGAGLRERFGFRGWGGTGPGLKGWEKVEGEIVDQVSLIRSTLGLR